MPEFIVRVHDGRQGARTARVQAEHAGAVAQALGVAPQHLLAVVPLAQSVSQAGRGGLKLRLFSQELAVLLDAGIPLLEALVTLQERGSGAAAGDVLGGVIAALREGRPLSAALAQQPRHFDALFVAMVAACERTGQLPVTLRDHAAYLAWSEGLKDRLVSAAVYPLMLLGVGGSVIVFLLLYVLPRFAGVFDGLARELPAASRWLIDFGVLAARQPALSIAVALVLPLGGLLVWRLPSTRQRAAAALWQLPGLGRRLRVVALARLYRSLGLLLAAGVPVLQALRLLDDVAAAPLRPALKATAAAVGEGQRLSDALQAQALATPVALRMLRVGERSGEVAAMLARAAAFHDEEVARDTELLTRAVSPVLMLVMGVLIGGIVVLMYLPIFTLVDQVQ